MNPIKLFCIADDEYHPSAPIVGALKQIVPHSSEIFEASEGELRKPEFEPELMVIAKMNVCSRTDRTPWTTPEFDDWLKANIENGGRLLVLHAGLARYPKESIIRQLAGGEFITHPAPLQVRYESSRHSFEVHDEHYIVEIDPDVEVFLTSQSEANSQPAGWRKRVKQGKIVALTPTHFDENWKNETWQKIMKEEIEWLLS